MLREILIGLAFALVLGICMTLESQKSNYMREVYDLKLQLKCYDSLKK